MRTDTWLVLDCNFLCRRASYVFRGLSHEEFPTGVIFGFLSDLLHFQQRFDALQVVCCFDHGRSKRYRHFPGYKAARQKKKLQATPEEKKVEQEFRDQIYRLWAHILPEIGFENVLIADGFEADDWIAKAVQTISRDFPDDQSVIISSDRDMFQLIGPRTQIWNPNSKRLYTLQSFNANYGVTPQDWIRVKAISGCSSDGIPGAEKIGEKTALKYLKGELMNYTQGYRIIHRFLRSPEFGRNMLLVQLPFIGIPDPQLVKHEVSPRKWKQAMIGLGMDSLAKDGPYIGRRSHVG